MALCHYIFFLVSFSEPFENYKIQNLKLELQLFFSSSDLFFYISCVIFFFLFLLNYIQYEAFRFWIYTKTK